MTKLKKTPVFVLTVKNSKREYLVKKRLKSLKINYKIFYAIDGKNQNNFKILYKKYNKKKCLNELGRDMTYTEISNAEGHLRIYKYIINKNISNAVIMEDDCYPSKLLCDWLKLDYFFSKKKYDIIQIYHSFGLVYKKSLELILDKFFIYKACFPLPYTTCYQITQKACKYITDRNKRVSRLVDWPINFHSNKIKQHVVLPYIVSLRSDHISTSYQKVSWMHHHKLEKIKKIIPFYDIITAIYFLTHIPFLMNICKNYLYYKEKFLLKKIFYIKNLFSDNYINLETTLKKENFYPADIKKNARKSLFF
jgi:GR25 family glycosyltransferase involved in LPS biosynthesis